MVRSQELITAVVILTGTLLLRGPGKQLGLGFAEMLTSTLVNLPTAAVTVEGLRGIFLAVGVQILPPLAFLLFGLMLAGAAVTLGQTQFLWAGKKIGMDFKRMNPLEGFKRIFSTRGLYELLRSLLKLGWVAWIAYGFLRSRFFSLITLTQLDLKTAVDSFIEVSISLAIRVGSMYLVIAVADYAYQRWDLYKNLRMSKDEIKQELKRSEGDPMLKSRIRSMQRRMARGRMMANVARATVVVTNPTHLAVAIEYNEGMKVPRVLAKGPYHVAEKIVQIAKENRIPVIQNIPLARAIYKTIEIGQEISPDLYLAMAEVLAYVFKLRGKTPLRKERDPRSPASGPVPAG